METEHSEYTIHSLQQVGSVCVCLLCEYGDKWVYAWFHLGGRSPPLIEVAVVLFSISNHFVGPPFYKEQSFCLPRNDF